MAALLLLTDERENHRQYWKNIINYDRLNDKMKDGGVCLKKALVLSMIVLSMLISSCTNVPAISEHLSSSEQASSMLPYGVAPEVDIPGAELLPLEKLSDGPVSWLDESHFLITFRGYKPSHYGIYDLSCKTTEDIIIDGGDINPIYAGSAESNLIFQTFRYDVNINYGYVVDKAWVYNRENKTLLEYNTAELTEKSYQGIPLASDSHVFYLSDNSQIISVSYYPSEGDYIDLSPDGKKVAYCDEKGLWIANTDLTDKRFIEKNDVKSERDMDGEIPKHPYWIDNETLSYHRIGYEWVVDTRIVQRDGSNLRILNQLKELEISTVPEWKDQLIAYSDIDQQFGICRLNGQYTDLTKQMKTQKASFVSVSPNGKYILYKTDKTLYLATLDSTFSVSAIYPVTNLDEHENSVAFSPDSKYFLYYVYGESYGGYGILGGINLINIADFVKKS